MTALPTSLARPLLGDLNYDKRNKFSRLQFHYCMHDAVIPDMEMPLNPGAMHEHSKKGTAP